MASAADRTPRIAPAGRMSARNRARDEASPREADARLAAPHNRRPEGPPDRGGPSLDDGRRRPRPAPRPHPARARPRGRPRRVQRPRRRCYQDQLFALVVRMVPDRDQASDVDPGGVLLARTATSRGFRGGSVKSWLNRIAVNAAMDIQRARKRRPVQPYPELEDESWQPPAGESADPGARPRSRRSGRTSLNARPRDDHRRPADGDRPVRRRGLRLRRDRRDDRGLARAP